MEIQIVQDEPDYIECLFVAENCHFATYFGLDNWEYFKKAINSFDLNWRTTATIDSANKELSVYIDMQMGDKATLHVSDNKGTIQTLLGFKTKTEWKKFKADVNAFKVHSDKEE